MSSSSSFHPNSNNDEDAPEWWSQAERVHPGLGIHAEPILLLSANLLSTLSKKSCGLYSVGIEAPSYAFDQNRAL